MHVRIALAVSAATLALYAWTLAPTVTLVDSGELIVAAWSLGVAHPPGFPLYTLLAHAFTWLPIGTVAERVHLLSAVAGALAAGVVTLLVGHVATRARLVAAPIGNRRRAGPALDAAMPPWVIGGAAASAGLLMGTSRTLWAYATVAEVYTLTILLLVSALYWLVRWHDSTLETGPRQDAFLYAAAGCVGLGLSVHHATIVLAGTGLAWLVWSGARRQRIPAHVWVGAAACGAAGVLFYLYLPWAAGRDVVLDWGDPSSLERFWWHVSGRQYQVYFAFSLETMARQFGDDFGRYLLREFGPRWLPLALGLAALGAAHLWRANRALTTALALVVMADLVYALNYDIDEDKDAYYLLTFLVTAILSGVGAARLLAAATMRQGLARAGLVAVVAATPVVAGAANYRFNDRSSYFIARDYVDNVLGTVASDGLLLTRDWQLFAPSLYARHIDGARPDVTIIDVNLLRRSWYFDYLDREYPETMARVRPQASAYLAELRQWDRDPDLYQIDVARNRRISERWDALLDALLDTQVGGPVYITLELLADDPDMSRRLARWVPVPQGLVFQLAGPGEAPALLDPDLIMRGLFDDTIAFEPDDVVRQKVAPVYLSMLVNRGRYLASRGDTARAEALYRRALSLAPDFRPALASLQAMGAGSR